MKKTIKILAVVAGAAALLALGAGGAWWWLARAQQQSLSAPAATAAGDEEKKVLYWYDPMYPQQHFDQPGPSPFMDMELVPRYAENDRAGGSDETAGVQIDPQIQQNLGLRLATVEPMTRHATVEATGIIAFNERDVAIEQVRVGGFVEKVWPLAPGDVIAAGQALLDMRVPEWTAAQQEWLAIRASGDADLLAAARERLLQVGLSDAQIRQLEQTGEARSRFVIKASRAGVIQELAVRAGMTLMPGQTLARINGISTVWLDVAVAQAQLDGLRVDGPAEAQLPGFPERVFAGRISAILPMLNEDSRSLRVRVELPNTDGVLRPGMSAQVKLHAGSDDTALAVPTEAIIRTGKRTLVIVADEANRFTPVAVTVGREMAEHTEIVSGVQRGQKVVASGQFLIDSEASLSGVLARTAPDSSGSMNAEMADRSHANLHEAEAVVQAIGIDDITLAHGPFPTLAMPGMTMTFPLARGDLVTTIQVGDRVRVGVRETDDGLLVEQITLLASAKPSGVQP